MSLWFILLLIHKCQSAVIHWDHGNISEWVHLYPECGGSHQSPIDIITDDASACNEALTLNWTSQTTHFGVRNSGHTLHIIPFEIRHLGGSNIAGLEVLHHTNDTKIRLQNSFYNTFKSAVNKEYCFDSLHFHWANTNNYGSEHTINGIAYPLEVHLVHYSCDYNTLGDALDAYVNGNLTGKYDDHHILGVIGVLFEVGNEHNPVLDKILTGHIINGTKQYHDPEHATDGLLQLYYTEFDMIDLIPENKEMIAYQGSLTTPPCFETVRWHVMRDTMSVTQTQLDRFRSILDSTHTDDFMAPNYRPVQEMYDRATYQCQDIVNEQQVVKEARSGAVSETDEEILSDYYDEYRNWFVVGIVFICLFVVSIAIIGYLSYLVYCKKSDKTEDIGRGPSPKAQYYKTRSESAEVKDLADTTANAENNYH